MPQTLKYALPRNSLQDKSSNEQAIQAVFGMQLCGKVLHNQFMNWWILFLQKYECNPWFKSHNYL